MTGASELPAGFEALEQFVSTWAAATSQERWYIRSAASMDEIKRFYDAALAHLPDAMTCISKHDIDNLPPSVGTLYRLMLGLIQASIAVEFHGQPRAPYSSFPVPIRLTGCDVYG